MIPEVASASSAEAMRKPVARTASRSTPATASAVDRLRASAPAIARSGTGDPQSSVQSSGYFSGRATTPDSDNVWKPQISVDTFESRSSPALARTNEGDEPGEGLEFDDLVASLRSSDDAEVTAGMNRLARAMRYRGISPAAGQQDKQYGAGGFAPRGVSPVPSPLGSLAHGGTPRTTFEYHRDVDSPTAVERLQAIESDGDASFVVSGWDRSNVVATKKTKRKKSVATTRAKSSRLQKRKPSMARVASASTKTRKLKKAATAAASVSPRLGRRATAKSRRPATRGTRRKGSVARPTAASSARRVSKSAGLSRSPTPTPKRRAKRRLRKFKNVARAIGRLQVGMRRRDDADNFQEAEFRNARASASARWLSRNVSEATASGLPARFGQQLPFGSNADVPHSTGTSPGSPDSEVRSVTSQAILGGALEVGVLPPSQSRATLEPRQSVRFADSVRSGGRPSMASFTPTLLDMMGIEDRASPSPQQPRHERDNAASGSMREKLSKALASEPAYPTSRATPQPPPALRTAMDSARLPIDPPGLPPHLQPARNGAFHSPLRASQGSRGARAAQFDANSRELMSLLGRLRQRAADRVREQEAEERRARSDRHRRHHDYDETDGSSDASSGGRSRRSKRSERHRPRSRSRSRASRTRSPSRSRSQSRQSGSTGSPSDSSAHSHKESTSRSRLRSRNRRRESRRDHRSRRRSSRRHRSASVRSRPRSRSRRSRRRSVSTDSTVSDSSSDVSSSESRHGSQSVRRRGKYSSRRRSGGDALHLRVDVDRLVLSWSALAREGRIPPGIDDPTLAVGAAVNSVVFAGGSEGSDDEIDSPLRTVLGWPSRTTHKARPQTRRWPYRAVQTHVSLPYAVTEGAPHAAMADLAGSQGHRGRRLQELSVAAAGGGEGAGSGERSLCFRLSYSKLMKCPRRRMEWQLAATPLEFEVWLTRPRPRHSTAGGLRAMVDSGTSLSPSGVSAWSAAALAKGTLHTAGRLGELELVRVGCAHVVVRDLRNGVRGWFDVVSSFGGAALGQLKLAVREE